MHIAIREYVSHSYLMSLYLVFTQRKHSVQGVFDPKEMAGLGE